MSARELAGVLTGSLRRNANFARVKIATDARHCEHRDREQQQL